MRLTFEATLVAAQVDLVLAGHVHAYERFTNIVNNTADSAGPVYITIGDGGNREGLATKWINPQPSTSIIRQASYGHGELTVVNATHMLWEWHQNPDLEPTVADSVYIVAGHPSSSSSFEEGHGKTSTPQFRVRL